MGKLVESLPLPQRRAEMIDDCCALLDTEVRRKGGISGLAVKGAYALLKKLKPGAVREAVDGLFDDFIAALEPLWAEWGGGDGGFGAFLKRNSSRVAQSFLGVTDQRAARSRHTTLASAYRKLRPAASRHVEEAVPGLADLIERFLSGK